MKKVLKSKIFIVIICGIIFTSLGVYGASKYQVSEVLYNPSSGESMTVNEALNELYEKANSSGCNSGICTNENVAKVGDYVKMTPTKTTYTVNSTKTGWKESENYSSDEVINPSELNLWRIIKINEDGTIEMVSENASSTDVHFEGQTGYLNLVGTLNEIASQYENSKYTINSRIMGYNGQTEYLTDTSIFTNPAPWTSSTSDNSNEKLGGGDIMYLEDTNLVTEVLGTLAAKTPSGAISSYWLGSRYYDYFISTYYNVGRASRVG